MFHKERINCMKMTRLIQIGVAAFMAVALGCTTSDTNKYVGTWGGRSTKAKDGVMIKLEEGGGGYASTYVGAVPLKWRVTNVNHLDVRFGCGDGFLSFYDMVYLPDEKARRTANAARRSESCQETATFTIHRGTSRTSSTPTSSSSRTS